MLNDDLYRIVVRARRRWDRKKSIPTCSNEAAAEAEGKPLFGDSYSFSNDSVNARSNSENQPTFLSYRP